MLCLKPAMLPVCHREKADLQLQQNCPEQGSATFMCVLMAATGQFCFISGQQQLTAAIESTCFIPQLERELQVSNH